MEEENIHLEDTEHDVRSKVIEIFEDNMKSLKQIWMDTFGKKICNEHLLKLSDHVQTFFDEVNQESRERQTVIIDKIKTLYEEAREIKRLMKVDIDIKPSPDVPLYSAQVEMDERLVHLRMQLKERKDQIYEYLMEQETLCEELGEEPRELRSDPLPTEEELNNFREYLSGLKDEKFKRCDEISNLRRQTKEVLKCLEIPLLCDAENNLVNDRNISPKMTNVRKLRSLYDTFAKQHEDMCQQINQMRQKLNTLWDYLQVNNSKQIEFEKYNTATQTTYDKFSKELERCEALKRENIQTFVEKVREEIASWWDKCLKSQEERQRFTTFKSTVFTEDLLTIHEMELNDLKSFFENNEVIFKMYHERKGLWDRMQQLESTSHDPGRYTNRGGNLLKEERERKTISKRLPKLEAEIYELVAAYNKRHKRPFTVYGRPIEETIQLDWERNRELKQTQLSARKKKDTTPTNLKSNHVTTIKTPRTVGSNLTAGRKMTKMMASASTISVASSRYLHPSSARKPTNVTRSATTLRAGDKRKLPAPPLSMAHAKRSLLKELSNSPAFLKPSKPVTKQSPSRLKPPATATLKVYEAGSANKRRSRSGNGLTKQRMNSSKRRQSNRLKVPQLHLNSSGEPQSTHSESVSYEVFEDFLEIDPKCRSSIAPNKRRARTNAKQVPNGQINNAGNNEAGNTPAKLPRTISCSSATKKSPAASRATSPAPGSNSKKLTTKNLPIMF